MLINYTLKVELHIIIPRGMAQDTGKFRKNTKDQYYTRLSIAKDCVDCILDKCPDTSQYQWVEPSAGNGSFLKALPNEIQSIGIDLDPKMDGVLKGDFLTWEPTSQMKKVFFGNPPFGKQGSLAKSFIQHAAKYADVIAFILPKSFVKPSMSRAFPSKFHCIFEKELPKDSFEVNKVAYDVPCVFQIWQKKSEDRPKDEHVSEIGFKYVKATEDYDIAFRRVGGKAGTCFLKGSGDFSVQSHYFLKLDNAHVVNTQKIIEAVNKHVFPSNTVGPRSLSKTEANLVLNQVVASYA
jgi:hypothetical protein